MTNILDPKTSWEERHGTNRPCSKGRVPPILYGPDFLRRTPWCEHSAFYRAHGDPGVTVFIVRCYQSPLIACYETFPPQKEGCPWNTPTPHPPPPIPPPLPVTPPSGPQVTSALRWMLYGYLPLPQLASSPQNTHGQRGNNVASFELKLISPKEQFSFQELYSACYSIMGTGSNEVITFDVLTRTLKLD